MSDEKSFDDYFSEAVDGVNAEEPEAQEPEKEEEVQPQQDTPTDDIFNKIPDGEDQDNQPKDVSETIPDWKALYDQEKQKTSSWNGRIKKANDRADELEAKLSDAVAHIQALEQKLQDKSTLPADKAAAGASSEDADLQEFFDEYPDLVKPLKKLINLEANRVASDAVSRVRPDVEILKRSSEQVAKDQHIQVIADAHPDFRVIMEGGYFDKWADAQPEYLQQAINRVKAEGTASEVIDVFNSFKKATGWKYQAPKPERSEPDQSKIKAMLAVEGSTGGPPKGKPDPNDFDSAWKEATAERH